jgi:hypothetical protein
LARASNPAVFYELTGAAGQGAVTGTLPIGPTLSGSWDFAVNEPSGTLLLLYYPDFPNDPVPIFVP